MNSEQVEYLLSDLFTRLSDLQDDDCELSTEEIQNETNLVESIIRDLNPN
tara:strand:+ start:372 stop:521 length:150 start_codon:yes stop_codon:yes gene_type:complete